MFFALPFLAGCVIPGGVLDGGGDQELLPVPRRVEYNITNDPFVPRADLLVYKCKKDGTMVLVPIGSVDRVGIIDWPSLDPESLDEVSRWIDPMGSWPPPGSSWDHKDRYDVVVVAGGMSGRYSVWINDDPTNPLNPVDPPGGGGFDVVWSGTINKVTLSPLTQSLPLGVGGPVTVIATVDGVGTFNDTVTWTVTGAVEPGTTWTSASGPGQHQWTLTLDVDPTETGSITVTAASAVDPISGLPKVFTATVTIGP
jgi:hypothetical protein